MADNQPATPPAADGGTATPPQQPGQAPAADNQPQTPAPLIAFDSLDEDQKKYLAGQGITSQDQLTGENLLKVVNHARSSQQTAAERQAELDKIKGVVSPQQQTVNPFASPGAQPSTTPQQPAAPAPETPAAAPQAPQMDNLQMFTLANQLGGMFPELADDLTSGTFYKGMQDIGIPLRLPDGQINLNGITTYGKNQQQIKQYEKKLEELNAPPTGAQAPAEPQTPAQPAADAPMTKQMAQAILLQDPHHARAAEAQTFLQSQS